MQNTTIFPKKKCFYSKPEKIELKSDQYKTM